MRYKLEELFDLYMGKTPSRNNSKYWCVSGNKWISIGDVSQSGMYINKTKECISNEAVQESGIRIIPKNTVIMSFKLSIGKVAITAEDMFSNEAIMAFHDKGVVEILPEYLYFLLLQKDWADGANKAVKGMTLNKATLSKVEIEVCDIETQKRVVNIMNTMSAILYKFKTVLGMIDMLIKSRFVEMFGDISTGEYKYVIKKLGDVAKVGSSHRVFTTEFVDIGVPFYRGTEIGDLANGLKPSDPYYISEEHYKRLASDDTKPKVGDLLMPSICNNGQVWMVDTEEPFYYKDGRVLCISADRNIYNTRYLQYYMKVKTEIEYPKMGSGSTFAEFKIFLLKEFDVLTPPLDIQNQFADFVQQVDKLKVAVQKGLDKAQMLFDSLMQQYFG